jgi:NMD protein affecting ribosome stability and mRNA decay
MCPACRKIKQRSASGEVDLRAIAASERGELLRLLRNEENQAREKNPLERIMSIEAANGGWKITTTTEKLAQRLGRSIRKARGGKLTLKWSHNNKFVRVFWEPRPTADKSGAKRIRV